jgi:hypothetical protein
MRKLKAALILSAIAFPGAAWAEVTKGCEQLAHLAIPAAMIGLPTHGGVVTAAQTIVPKAPAGVASGAASDAAYCLVSGAIAPVDAKASEIHFQIALPATWNGKMVMFGGGGFEGTIADVTQSPNNADPRTPSPLARGYAVFATDGGHQQTSMVNPGAFLLNDEAYRNWMGDALKKTRDAALSIVKADYGRAPANSYFLGGSSGGREGLQVAARWPGDWDGVVSLYPGRNSVLLTLGAMGANRAFAAPGAFSNPAKRQVLYHAALAACDTLDGAADGVISDEKRCNSIFHPKTAMLEGKPVRCPGGADTGDSCLSDAQLAAFERAGAARHFAYPLAGAEQDFPGYNIYTADSGLVGSPLRPFVSLMSMGDAQPAHPYTPAMSFADGYADNFVRYGITRDAAYNHLTMDPEHPGKYAARIGQLARLESIGDLGPFAARGGKLLVMHGTADMLISSRMTEAYYAHLNRTMGTGRVASFLRFYEAPGFAHGISDVFNVSWDYLTALENWRERGVDPAQNEVITDSVGVPGRTRPLCLYPSWPKYRGAGDVNSAASFQCAVK